VGRLQAWVNSGALRAGTPGPTDDYWYQPYGYGIKTAAGIAVNPEQAMRLDTVMACTYITSRAMGMIPKKVYRRRPDGGSEVASNHPLFDVLYSRPNYWQTSLEWFEMMQAHFELRGNAYSEIVPGPRGAVDQLIPLHPDRITVEVLGSGNLRYQYSDPKGGIRPILQQEMFHLRNLSTNGIVGLSTVCVAAETIGAGIAAADYANRFLANDVKPGLVITGANFKDPAAKQEFKQNLREDQTGSNRHGAMVLPAGLDAKNLGVTNVDAQLLETRKFTRSQLGAIWGIPLHKLGETEKVATYSSVEQAEIAFVTHCILPRVVAWEQAIMRDLILAPQLYFVKFSLQSLMRGDMVSRYNAYAQGIQWGWLCPDDIREFEDMNPVPGGKTFLIPANMNIRGSDGRPIVAAGTQQNQLPAADRRVVPIVIAAAERCVRKEVSAVQKLRAKSDSEFKAALKTFYGEHQGFVSEVMTVASDSARMYCETNCKALESVTAADQVEALIRDEMGSVRVLSSLTMETVQ
jgi:HK97 family phage portal protein